jgi:hypothetical protein
MFFDGQWTESSSEGKSKVLNPATEEEIATVPEGTREDVRRALDAAEEAQRKWEDHSSPNSVLPKFFRRPFVLKGLIETCRKHINSSSVQLERCRKLLIISRS